MAIEVDFKMGPPVTADQVTDVLSHAAVALGLIESSEAWFARPGAYLRSGLLVSSSASKPIPVEYPEDRLEYEEKLGFVPTADVYFRYNRTPGAAAAQDWDLVRLVAALLHALPGGAWLAFQGETAWLRRRDGRLTLSDDDKKWTPEETALMPAHDRASLPNM